MVAVDLFRRRRRRRRTSSYSVSFFLAIIAHSCGFKHTTRHSLAQ